MEPSPTPSQTPANPFSQLLLDCQNDTGRIQDRYETHRTNRNAQFRERLLHEDFPGWQIDEILSKLVTEPESSTGESIFTDHRHNLNLYARPPRYIKDLIAKIQVELCDVARTLWFTPPESLHITALEIASSRTQDEIDTLAAELLQNGTARRLVHYTTESNHRTRLVKPILSYDASAMALSFLPAAGEPTATGVERTDAHSYHHLREGLANVVLESRTALAARYVVPSAHITIARFVNKHGSMLNGHEVDRSMVAALVERIERINETLKRMYWPRFEALDGDVERMPVEGEWFIGQEQGLEFNKGTSWYGGGEKVLVGPRLER